MWFVSDRAGRVVAKGSDANGPIKVVRGDTVSEHLAPDYREVYEASWEPLFYAIGAQRSFDTLAESENGLWCVSVHDESFLADDGDVKVHTELVPKYQIARAALPKPTVEKAPSRVANDGQARRGADRHARVITPSSSAKITADGDPIRRLAPSLMEWEGLALIVMFAFILRLWDLTNLPSGLHGDEAITGIEGWRVASEGNIGVYTGSALGQPTLMYYPMALFQELFGNGIFVLRSFATLGGVLAIIATWGVTRRHFGPVAAAAAALTLTVMVWSLHYSRIAFSLAWWPLVGIAAIYFLDTAMETNSRWRWALAGFATGLGVYIYNAHWIFIVAVGTFTVGWVIVNRNRLGEVWSGLAIAAASGAVTLLPMFSYILDDQNNYSSHLAAISIQATPAWQTSSLTGRMMMLAHAYKEAWVQLVGTPDIDYVDAAGIIKPIGVPIFVASVIGFGIVAVKYRSRFFALAMTIILVMPLAPAFTQAGHGWLRRDYIIAPVLAIFVGVLVATVIDSIRDRVNPLLLGVIVAAPIVMATLMTIDGYFSTFRNNPTQQWVFVAELSEPARIMAAYGDGVFVNFYSPRHSIHYETLQYLTPRTQGIDRSVQFGDRPGIGIVERPDMPQLFVLIGGYTDNLPELMATLKGVPVEKGTSGGVPYAVFLAVAQ